MANRSRIYELMVRIGGQTDSSLRNACNAAERNLNALQRTAGKVKKAIAVGAAIVGTATVVGIGASLNEYESFQQAMTNTAAIAQATASEEAAMAAAAREMGAKTTKTATEAAEALGYMALAGWNAEESIAGLEPVLRLSEATQMDLARCSDLVTDSMSALGLNVADMNAYLNMVVQTNNKANTSAEALMEAYIGCGGTAKTVGVDISDLSTALGILANNGSKGAEAGTALNSILVRISSKDTAINAMHELGVSVYDTAGNFRGLETVLGDVAAAMDGMSAQEKAAYMSRIAGTNYYTEMSYLLDAVAASADGTANAWEGLESELAKANSGDGALLQMVTKVNDTLSGAKAIFNSALSEMKLSLGEQIAPYMQATLLDMAENTIPLLTEKLTAILPVLIEGGKWVAEHIDLILALGAGITACVVAYKTAKFAITAYNAVMATYRVVTAAGATVTSVMAGAMGALNLPLLAAVAAIGLLVAAGVLLYKNWDQVKAKAAELWAAFQERFPGIAAFVEKCWQNITAAFNNGKAVLSNIIDFVRNVFTGNWQAAWQNVVNIFGNLFGGLVNLAKVPINAVVSAINFVLTKINGVSLDIPDWVPGVGGKTLGFNLPTIPLLAAGGIAASPTLAMVGEGGEPEAIMPLSKLADMLEGLTPQHSFAGVGGNAFGDNITFAPVFNISGNADAQSIKSAAQLAFSEFKAMYQRLKAEERRKSFRQ